MARPESQQIDVKLFANFHAMKSVGMETNTSTSWNQTSYETWQKSKKELKVYAIGAKPPSGDVSQWQGLVVEVTFLPSLLSHYLVYVTHNSEYSPIYDACQTH